MYSAQTAQKRKISEIFTQISVRVKISDFFWQNY